jgi:hypothetical protein
MRNEDKETRQIEPSASRVLGRGTIWGFGDEVLLSQGAYADWADSVARRGQVLYTNIVYWKALCALGQAAESLDLKNEPAHYFAEDEAVSGAIEERFWRPDLGYFVTSERLEQFSRTGNLLASAWELATSEQTESILRILEETEMAKPVPTRVSHPAYPLSQIAIQNVLGGLANYHTEASWLWIGAWHVIALVRSRHLVQAQEILERIVEVIIRDKKSTLRMGNRWKASGTSPNHLLPGMQGW